MQKYKEVLEKEFKELEKKVPYRYFDWVDERVIFHRGFRFTHHVDEDLYTVHSIKESDMYTRLSEGELSVLIEKGFYVGTAILQRGKCLLDIERLTQQRFDALDKNNHSRAKKVGKQRKKLVDKLNDIEAFLGEHVNLTEV